MLTSGWYYRICTTSSLLSLVLLPVRAAQVWGIAGVPAPHSCHTEITTLQGSPAAPSPCPAPTCMRALSCATVSELLTPETTTRPMHWLVFMGPFMSLTVSCAPCQGAGWGVAGFYSRSSRCSRAASPMPHSASVLPSASSLPL